MFETLMTWPWWIFCTVLTFGAAAYGIAMRFVDPGIHPSVFAFFYTGAGALILGFICVIYSLTGGELYFSGKALILALILGVVFIMVDLNVIYMYRAGAPVSLGMPLVRTAVALITSFIGIALFAEDLDVIKALGILFSVAGVFLMGQKKKEAA